MLVRFHSKGKTYEATLPPQYYDDGITYETLQKTILQQIVKEPNFNVERAKGMHLKLLAVRSGLGNYGRNNLCYVEGMGSLLRLVAYFTDCKLEDNWTEIKMMDICKNCRACMINCPNHCITEENFVIDAGKCLSLYNEIEGEFPEWISPSAHNALIGCMRCQSICPGNNSVISQTGRLGEVTEEETSRILNGTPDQRLLDSLSKKLRDFAPTQSAEAFSIFTRNLKALLNTESNTPK